jgi:hypothetical protein
MCEVKKRDGSLCFLTYSQDFACVIAMSSHCKDVLAQARPFNVLLCTKLMTFARLNHSLMNDLSCKRVALKPRLSLPIHGCNSSETVLHYCRIALDAYLVAKECFKTQPCSACILLETGARESCGQEREQNAPL